MGKANQLPTTIITLWGDAHNESLDVAVVKNRFGPQDAMAKKFFRMKARPALCLIEEDDSAEGILFRDGITTPENLKVNNLFEED